MSKKISTATKATAATLSHTLADMAVKAQLTAAELLAVRVWLTEGLVANTNAKLGQGGHAETAVALRQVFVDLPTTSEETNLDEEDKQGFLERFMAAPHIHANLNAKVAKTLIPAFRRYQETEIGASLLIGGPGQGKSTLGQYACQLHRVALLTPFAADLTNSQQELLLSFYATPEERTSSKNQLSPPQKPLFPLQINLPDFARWQANERPNPAFEHVPQILRFLAQQTSASNLNAELLRKVCAKISCLLVLDGFDEVGAQEDRKKIITSAQHFLLWVALETDIKILATTRPQGYAGELSQIGIPLQEHHLSLLSPQEALDYAAALVAAKIANHLDRQKTLDRLRDAATEPSTQRLMSTPLQVTILTALV